MQEKNNKYRVRKPGRKPLNDPAIFRHGMKLNSVENAKFESLFLKSGLRNKSEFLKSVVFGKTIKVVKLDKGTMDYYMRLTTFYAQYNMIGVNYNQTVKALKSNFSEKRAFVLIKKLENSTLELVKLTKKVIELTHEFEGKWLKNETLQ